MLRKEMNIRQRPHPIPIAVLISTANTCDCDIYIENGQSRINVKDYDEMKNGFNTEKSSVTFCFNDHDEDKAGQRIAWLFAP